MPTNCSIEGCRRRAVAKGWCSMHYWRLKRGMVAKRARAVESFMNTGRTKTVTMRMSAKIRLRLLKFAKKEQISESLAIARIVEKALARLR